MVNLRSVNPSPTFSSPYAFRWSPRLERRKKKDIQRFNSRHKGQNHKAQNFGDQLRHGCTIPIPRGNGLSHHRGEEYFSVQWRECGGVNSTVLGEFTFLLFKLLISSVNLNGEKYMRHNVFI